MHAFLLAIFFANARDMQFFLKKKSFFFLLYRSNSTSTTSYNVSLWKEITLQIQPLTECKNDVIDVKFSKFLKKRLGIHQKKIRADSTKNFFLVFLQYI